MKVWTATIERFATMRDGKNTLKFLYEVDGEGFGFFCHEILPFHSVIYEACNAGKSVEVRFVSSMSPKFGKCLCANLLIIDGESTQDISSRRILIHRGNRSGKISNYNSDNCFIPFAISSLIEHEKCSEADSIVCVMNSKTVQLTNDIVTTCSSGLSLFIRSKPA